MGYPSLDDVATLMDKVYADPACKDGAWFYLRGDTITYTPRSRGESFPSGAISCIDGNQLRGRDWAVQKVHHEIRQHCVFVWTRFRSSSGAVAHPTRIKRLPDAQKVRRAAKDAVSKTWDTLILCDVDTALLLVMAADPMLDIPVSPPGLVRVCTVSSSYTDTDIQKVERLIAESLSKLKEP